MAKSKASKKITSKKRQSLASDLAVLLILGILGLVVLALIALFALN